MCGFSFPLLSAGVTLLKATQKSSFPCRLSPRLFPFPSNQSTTCMSCTKEVLLVNRTVEQKGGCIGGQSTVWARCASRLKDSYVEIQARYTVPSSVDAPPCLIIKACGPNRHVECISSDVFVLRNIIPDISNSSKSNVPVQVTYQNRKHLWCLFVIYCLPVYLPIHVVEEVNRVTPRICAPQRVWADRCRREP
ncbi:hypothetical protein F4808DRAFT_2510 [Astrocystis sublimbata]|nr:hypothetical protein F4808DRAFT_2510 [Astrocystis sublimbata]